MAKRNRISSGRLVASTNRLKQIASKRLDIEVLYVKKTFGYDVIKENILGIRPDIATSRQH